MRHFTRSIDIGGAVLAGLAADAHAVELRRSGDLHGEMHVR
jgi:hypothetical protein